MNQPYRTYTPNKRNISQRPSPANSPIEEPNAATARFSTPPPSNASPFSPIPNIQSHSSPSRTTPPHSAQSNKSNQVPFRPGFQARGIYRDRTEELVKLRNSKQESKRLEESRLQKRLEKLIELHFPFQPLVGSSDPPSNLDHQSQSSILNLSHTLIGIAKHLTNQPTESGQGAGGLNLINQHQNVRMKEQSIVRWQDDNQVKECKFCHTVFGLRVRKHHCRLCGSVVCFNPTWATGRAERCSTMIRFEWDPNFKSSMDIHRDKNQKEKSLHGKIIQLTEQEIGSIDQPHSSLLNLISPPTQHVSNPTHSQPTQHNQAATLKPKKAVRVCSHCLAIILRRQAMTSPPQIPHYLHIYSSLKSIQNQIELALPEFQELVSTSKHSSSNLNPKSGSNASTPTKLLTLRKKLLTNLTLFDGYSKELSSKLVDYNLKNNNNMNNGENGSEMRLIKAITTKAALFLRDHMSLIRSLGLLDLNSTPNPNNNNGNSRKVKKIQLQDCQPSPSYTTIHNNNNNNQQVEESTQQQQKQERELIKMKHVQNISIDSRIENENQSNNNNNARNQELIKLNVLLEQENLIESYLVQARLKRQLEDVASLTVSLDDLREEISNLKKTLL